MIADVGLVGFPNVGKSTLLSRITNAQPKIANYHFTTISPNLGVVDNGDGKGFVIADIPGLIEGASEGAGLGHAFLRHVERTRLLWHVIDISGSEGRDPTDDLDQINTELEQYRELGKIPQIIVCNKTDLPGAEENLKRVSALAEGMGCPVFPVSAATHQGFDALLDETARLLETLPPILHYQEEEDPEEEPKDMDAFEVTLEDGVYVVSGPAMERLIDSVNFEDQDSLNWFHRTLRRLGIIGALKDAGAGEGSTVRIADMEFDFIE